METSFADRVKLARRIKNLTQDQMAKEVGITRQAVSQLESGRLTKISKNLHKIAAALGVTEEWLVNGDSPGENALLISPQTSSPKKDEQPSNKKQVRAFLQKVALQIELYADKTGMHLSRSAKYAVLMEIYKHSCDNLEIVTDELIEISVEYLLSKEG